MIIYFYPPLIPGLPPPPPLPPLKPPLCYLPAGPPLPPPPPRYIPPRAPPLKSISFYNFLEIRITCAEKYKKY